MTNQTFKVRDRRGTDRFFVDNEVLDYSKKLGKAAIMVYMVLCRHANIDSQDCYPGYERIAKMAGCTEKSVSTSLRKLEHYRMIVIENRFDTNGKQTSNMYTLRDKSEWLPVGR